MPGRTIARSGPPALSGRTVVCDWTVTDASGATVDAGRNVFELALDGRFERVVGLRPV